MPTPSRFIDYPAQFVVMRVNSLRWSVYADYREDHLRRVAGPFWSKLTALRVEQALTQHFRNGWDLGNKGRAVYGGGRAA